MKRVFCRALIHYGFDDLHVRAVRCGAVGDDDNIWKWLTMSKMPDDVLPFLAHSRLAFACCSKYAFNNKTQFFFRLLECEFNYAQNMS